MKKPILALAALAGLALLLVLVLQLLGGPDSAPEPDAPELGGPATDAPERPAAELVGEAAGGAGSGGRDAASRPADADADAGAAGGAATEAVANLVTGLVVDADGAPVPAATVRFVPNGSAELVFVDDAPGGRTTTTDPEGRYELRDVPPGDDHLITAEHPERGRASSPHVRVAARGTTEEPPLVLQLGPRLTGVVRSESGEPVAGARLVLEQSLTPGRVTRGGDYRATESDEEGRYVFQGLQPARLYLTASAPGHASITLPGVLLSDDGSDAERDVVLPAAAELCGRVVGEEGEPVPDARVLASRYTDPQRTSHGHTTTDAEGRFCIEDLLEGTYSLSLLAPGYRQRAIVEAPTGQEAEIVVQRLPGVRGRVVDGATGEPLTTFAVRLRMGTGEGGISTPAGNPVRFTDQPDGAFHLPAGPNQQVIVEGRAAGFAPSFSSPLRVPERGDASGVVVRLLPGGTLRGRIVDADGQPVARARVTSRDAEWIDDEFSRALGVQDPSHATVQSAVTGADGDFALEHLSPASYQLQVQAEGFVDGAFGGFNLTAEADRDLGELALSRGATLTGVVRTPSGAPAPGALVETLAADRHGLPPARTKADAEGRYRFEHLSEGTWRVQAAPAGGAKPLDAFTGDTPDWKTVALVDGATAELDLELP